MSLSLSCRAALRYIATVRSAFRLIGFDRKPSDVDAEAARNPARNRKRRRLVNAGYLVAAQSVLVFAAPLALSAVDGVIESGEGEQEWRFRVMLDGKEIGFHRYEVESEGDRRIVASRAEFDVKFLFFNAYSYRHSLTARWNGACLEYLEADTNANGDKVSVTGERKEGEFVVEKGGEEKDVLPPCVMNFAYWDRRILKQSRLLNPQTGEYLDVAVQSLADGEVEVNGTRIPAEAYRITAKDMRIDLWYSKAGKRWIALESLAKGDRIIRYERTGTG